MPTQNALTLPVLVEVVLLDLLVVLDGHGCRFVLWLVRAVVLILSRTQLVFEIRSLNGSNFRRRRNLDPTGA